MEMSKLVRRTGAVLGHFPRASSDIRGLEFSRKVLEAPSPGRLSQRNHASDAPEDGGWERFQRLSGKARLKKGGVR
jgi:hypothetical protein